MPRRGAVAEAVAAEVAAGVALCGRAVHRRQSPCFVTTQATKAVVDSVARAQPAGLGRVAGGGWWRRWWRAVETHSESRDSQRRKILRSPTGRSPISPSGVRIGLPRFNGRVVLQRERDSAAASADSAEAGDVAQRERRWARPREGGAESGANRRGARSATRS